MKMQNTNYFIIIKMAMACAIVKTLNAIDA